MRLPTLGRPLAATFFLAALVTAGILTIAASWAGLSAAIEERDVGADLLSQNLAASRRARTLVAQAAGPSLFVEADSDTLAAAKVDALVRSLATAAGGTVLSSRAEVRPETGPGKHIELQATVNGGNDQLQALFLQLETGAPLVLIDALAIRAADTAGADPQAPLLQATMTLSAYWQDSKRTSLHRQ